MKSRSQKATKAEKIRYEKLKALGHCIACYDEKLTAPAVLEIHHMTSGGRRIGNEFTLPLCSYHHRGILPPDCRNSSTAELAYGPSFAKSKRKFIERYGTEAELLQKVNNLI